MMRYFLLAFLLTTLLVVSIAGCRGQLSRRPPIELFADMDRQPKIRPQTLNAFFADRLGSRRPVEGTVARNAPYADIPYHTGRTPGVTNFVEILPVPVTAALLARGQERFTIHCAVCHGAGGDGKGVISKYQMLPANLHDPRLVATPDGDLFNTISQGKNTMGAYGANVDIADRWAIVAYVRALQRSRLATLEDVPAAERAALPH